MSDGGPHVALAVICEKVIEDNEGVLSLIRIVDRVTQTPSVAKLRTKCRPSCSAT